MAVMQNKAVEVTARIGWLGRMSSATNQLNKQIEEFNRNGWEVQQVIPQGGANLFTKMIRTALFYATLGAYAKINIRNTYP